MGYVINNLICDSFLDTNPSLALQGMWLGWGMAPKARPLDNAVTVVVHGESLGGSMGSMVISPGIDQQK